MRSIILAIVAALAVAFILTPKPEETAAVSGTVTSSGQAAIGGAFSMTNQHGVPVTDADFRGKLMLVYFGFTYCPDVCPTDLLAISQAAELLGADAEKIAPVFISIDPERDTPEQMKSYLSNFHPSITGLSGTAEQLKEATLAYKVYYAKVADKESAADYTMDHSAFIYLMDGEGNYLTHFAHGTKPEDITAKVREYLGALTPAQAEASPQAVRNVPLEVSGAWARPTMGGMKMGAAFLTVRNTGEADVTLTGAASEVAEKIELHETTQNDKGVMQMREVKTLVVPAGGEVALAPGGLHIMLIGVHEPLLAGDKFSLILHTGDGGAIDVPVEVKSLN